MAIPSTGYDTATITNPSSALTDFTLIIDLSRMSTDWWAEVDTSDGTRGRAAKNDGTTELACDWIDFNDTAETGILRVKWSGTLASSGTQVIRIYPPNTANAAYGVSDTYGQYNAYDSSCEGYWPLAEDGNDRTLNSRHGTAIGSITYGDTSGQIGSATSFNGSNAVNLGDSFLDGYTALTISALYNSDVTTGERSIISCWDGSTNQVLFEQNGTSLFSADQAFETLSISSAITTGVWNYAAFVINDGSNNRMRNNTTEVSGPSVVGTIAASSADLRIADNSTGSKRFAGSIQHAYVYSSAKDVSWRAQEYSQTNDNATFWGTWTWNSASTSYTIDADTGTFSISGSDVGLLVAREITAESGNYNITGSALDLLATRLINADSGTYNLTGSDVSLDLSVGFTLDADSGTFTINGSDVELERTYVLNADSGDYDLTGSDVQLIWSGQPLANGYVCMTLSGKTPQIIYTARKPEIGIDGKSPGIVIGGKGCR